MGVALRLDAGWKMRPDAPEDTDADAGRALAIALTEQPAAQVAPQIDALTIRSVELLGSPQELELTPRDALRHPLLSDWVPATFADVLGDCICSGRILMDAAPTAPVYLLFQVHEHDGSLQAATAVLQFHANSGPVQVRINYGARVSFGHVKTYQASGDGVYALGHAMRWLPPGGAAAQEDHAPTSGGGLVH